MRKTWKVTDASAKSFIGRKEKAKKLVLVSGHHDANWEFPLIRKFGSRFTALQAIPVISNYMLLAILIIRFILFLLQIPVGFLIEIIIIILLVAPIPIMVYIFPNMVSALRLWVPTIT